MPETRAGPGSTRARWCDYGYRSDLADVLRLQALGTLGDLELHRIALGEAAEALGLDRREVDEHVRTRLLRDKAKALRVVEPLHLTLCHICSNLCTMGLGPETGSTQATAVLGRAQTKIRETFGPRGSADSRMTVPRMLEPRAKV